MKRFFVFLLVFLMLPGCLGCGKDEERNEPSLRDRGLELCELLGEMAGSEAYFRQVGAPEETLGLLKGAAGRYSRPKAVYALTAEEDELLSSLGVDAEGLSRKLEKKLTADAYGTLPTRINAAMGSATLAAASLCSARKTFVSRDADECTVYLYTFSTGCPVMVVFTPGEDDTVSASACFVFEQELNTLSPSELESYLAPYPIQVKKVR